MSATPLDELGAAVHEDLPAIPNSDRRWPPVTELAMGSLALIVIGGIYLSSHLPKHVPLGPAVALLIASVVLFGVNVFLLTRVRDFAWEQFFQVAKWSLLAYCIIGAMIEYAFVRDHVGGGALVVLTLSLAVFAVHVPTLVGFTVARYYEPDNPFSSGSSGSAGGPA
ncbi:MAG: hypothetical protein JO321_05220 [Solirubrobacterales bacterium]|nr:hypothetical protein [Solirubrobacterales bacterium]MBV9167325.1 hypothetical protein [Solirubrobacterales bacterium]MBV9534799.1 hypothetical protein [Solirubrobacterales bacterium]